MKHTKNQYVLRDTPIGDYPYIITADLLDSKKTQEEAIEQASRWDLESYKRGIERGIKPTEDWLNYSYTLYEIKPLATLTRKDLINAYL